MTHEEMNFLGWQKEAIGVDSFYFSNHSNEAVEAIIQIMEEVQKPSVTTHFNFAYLLEPYAQQGYAKIVFIRDLRDVCVSTVYFINEALDIILGTKAPFNERLAFVIQNRHVWMDNSVFNIKKEANEALKWMQDPEVLVLRFEDLCGEKGGGSRESQLNVVRNVAGLLELSFGDDELQALADQVWGPSVTFRKGEIGDWRRHFNKAHIRIFKSVLGEELIRLGYETGYDW